MYIQNIKVLDFNKICKKSLQFASDYCIIMFVSYGSLVKRLRRRPLTAKTAVRFRYELLTVFITAQPGRHRRFCLCLFV